MSAESRRRAWIALRGLVRKELRQVVGDKRMLGLLSIAPLVQLVIFSYAATLDVATARVVMVDLDRTAESRALARRVASTDSLELAGWRESQAAADEAIAEGDAELALVVPRGYARALEAGGATQVQVVVDGSDSTMAGVGITTARGLVQAISTEALGERLRAQGAEAPEPARVEVRTRVWYNPDLKSRIFMVPGVLGTILVVVTMIATSMALVREKELGTLEQLLVTPVSRATMLAGKLLPFALIGLFDAVVIMLVATLWFGVPMRGNPLVLLAGVVPFLVCMLGLGLLVSIVSRTQQQAMMTAQFFVMIPMIYLSGFVFPVESMPRLVQPLTEAVPLRHLLVIVRGVMLKGAGLVDLAPSIGKLCLIALVVFVTGVARFRKRIA